MRVFCSPNIFLCQEILSSELSFSIQHRKQLLLGSYVWRALQLYRIFNLSSHRSISYTVLVLTLALISFLSVKRLCPKVPRNTLLWGKVPPNPLFLLFLCGKYCPGLPNASEPHYFNYFCWKIMPRTTSYLDETAPDPTIF